MPILSLMIRLLLTVGFVLIALQALTCLNLEKIILKNRLTQARLLIVLVAIWIGYSVASFIFSIADMMNTLIQLMQA